MHNILAEPDDILPPCPSKNRTIDSFNPWQCWNYFETRREDLPRLLRALRIEEVVHFPNRSAMSGEEVMLRGLYELVTGNDQADALEFFGRNQSDQSRAVTWFINHTYINFLDLVTDNLR